MDWIQVGGLAVNAALLAVVIFELRMGTRARRADIHRARREATMTAWRDVSAAMLDAEEIARPFLGAGKVSAEKAAEIWRTIRIAGATAETTPSTEESAVLAAVTPLRRMLNSAEEFCHATHLGVYDSTVAMDIAGWRLARTFDRYYEYIESYRRGRRDLYLHFEEFVTTFLQAHGSALPLDWAYFISDEDLRLGRLGEQRHYDSRSDGTGQAASQ